MINADRREHDIVSYNPSITESLEKRQSMMALFEFPEHILEKFLACFMRVRANDVI